MCLADTFHCKQLQSSLIEENLVIIAFMLFYFISLESKEERTGPGGGIHVLASRVLITAYEIAHTKPTNFQSQSTGTTAAYTKGRTCKIILSINQILNI